MLIILSSKFGTKVLRKFLTKSVSSLVKPILQNLKLEHGMEQQHVKNHDYQGRIQFE